MLVIARVVRAATVLLVCALIGTLVTGCDSKNSAVRTAAQRYAGYIASASTSDLQKLWQMTATDDPAAIRTAGDLLAVAPHRITDIDVGYPQPASAPEDVPTADAVDPTFVDFRQVAVRYRLDGTGHQETIMLARPQAQSGHVVASWRVVVPLTGSIAWKQPGFLDDPIADIYLDGTRIVRVPSTDDAEVQPLYPAVYRIQQRLDPYYASTVASLAVAGKAVPPPKQTLVPTQATRKLLRKQIWARFADCDQHILECPVFELAERHDPSIGEPGWWLGLIKKPSLKISNDGHISMSGGAFRYRDSSGTHVTAFRASARYALDNQSWKPMLIDVEPEEIR